MQQDNQILGQFWITNAAPFLSHFCVEEEGRLIMELIKGNHHDSGEFSFTPQIISWKRSLDYLPPETVCFEKYLFTAAAKVLFGGKPGELLLMREDPSFGGDLTSLLERAKELTCSWGVWLNLLGIVPLGARIVIYNRERVNQTLKRARHTALFINSGYSEFFQAEEFFAEIGRRWEQTGEIPHEIGIALGYPVKDVVGFLGITPLKYIGNYGWRVFGCEEPSLQLRDQYDQAKRAALGFLEEPVGETDAPGGEMFH